MAHVVELYVIHACPHCAEAREALEWRRVPFVEFDIEQDAEARERLLTLTGGQRTVPVVVTNGKPSQVGWMGRGCVF